MSFSRTDEKRVYEACKNVFVPSEGYPNKQKRIKEALERNRTLLTPLDAELGMPKMQAIVKSLLNKGIVQCESKAKEYFRGIPPPPIGDDPAGPSQVSNNMDIQTEGGDPCNVSEDPQTLVGQGMSPRYVGHNGLEETC